MLTVERSTFAVKISDSRAGDMHYWVQAAEDGDPHVGWVLVLVRNGRQISTVPIDDVETGIAQAAEGLTRYLRLRGLVAEAPTLDELKTLLARIGDKAKPAGVDFYGMPMVKIRKTLVDDIRNTLARL
jgi:hypothetical protein